MSLTRTRANGRARQVVLGILLIAVALAERTFGEALSPSPASAKTVIEDFYKAYLAPRKAPVATLNLPFSASFQALINENAKVCQEKAGSDDICGFHADADPYLDCQDSDPHLTYESSRMSVTEPTAGTVHVTFNVFPDDKTLGTEAQRDITYLMIHENGRWVVNEILYEKESARKSIHDEIAFYTRPQK